MRKMAPVKVPMPTQMTMILGPSRAALGISGLEISIESANGSMLLAKCLCTFNHMGDGILATVSYRDVG